MWFSLRTLFIAVAVLGVVLACIANLVHVYHEVRRVALEISDVGGEVNSAPFGMDLESAEPTSFAKFVHRRCPKWTFRVTSVMFGGTNVDDERLSRLELDRFGQLQRLSLGLDGVLGAGGWKWGGPAPPLTDKGVAGLPPLPRLRYMILYDLPVSDAGLKGIAQKYPRLECLNLWGTRVTDRSMVEVGQLLQLKELILHKTPVTDSGLVHLTGLTNLRGLDLSESCVAGPGLEHLTRLSRLEVLILRDTGVNDDSVRHFGRFQRLRTLNLVETEIGDEGVRQFVNLTKLENLVLDSTKVTDIGIEYLSQLPRLSHLSLRDTKVTDIGIEYLIQLPQLSSVSLDGAVATDDGLGLLAKKPSMKRMSLIDCCVTRIGIDDYLRRAPDRIVYTRNEVLTSAGVYRHPVGH
jgi:hypothetical protein